LDGDILTSFISNLFGLLRPQLIIISTPNAEFNVLFSIEGFRHHDHKFEWTRLQFKSWADDICDRYPPYSVEICGVGLPPVTYHGPDLGYCTQIAIFKRNDEACVNSVLGEQLEVPYLLIAEISYPVTEIVTFEDYFTELLYTYRMYCRRKEINLGGPVPLEELEKCNIRIQQLEKSINNYQLKKKSLFNLFFTTDGKYVKINTNHEQDSDEDTDLYSPQTSVQKRKRESINQAHVHQSKKKH